MCFDAEDENPEEVEAEDAWWRQAPEEEGRDSQITYKSFCQLLKIIENTIYTCSLSIQLYTYILSGIYLYWLFELSFVLFIWVFLQNSNMAFDVKKLHDCGKPLNLS